MDRDTHREMDRIQRRYAPRECDLCTPAAACECRDPVCRAGGYGQPQDEAPVSVTDRDEDEG